MERSHHELQFGKSLPHCRSVNGMADCLAKQGVDGSHNLSARVA